ncbi:hypothetical protein CWC08_18850, partial [Pseudoalteromonas ruthenica]|uniref:efflux RND transporter permease subunit n=1 Tax=Pseudoalteromonas ruthenica TaxID=151081 RepID=UPI0011099EDC
IPLLPHEVQQQGVSVAKSNGSFLMVICFISEDGSMNSEDIADYVFSNVKAPISRTPGVGIFTVFGSQYSMRISLDAQQLNKIKMTPT